MTISQIKMTRYCFVFLLSLFLDSRNEVVANKQPDDTISITCIFRGVHQPIDPIIAPSLTSYEKDFNDHLFMPAHFANGNSFKVVSKKINDSTWNLKLHFSRNQYYQVYMLSVIGTTYEVFLDSKEKSLTLYIDTTKNKSTPYKITPTSKSKFTFGIDLENDFNSQIGRDSTGAARNIHQKSMIFKALRQKYHKEIEVDEAFRKYVNMQVLWYGINHYRGIKDSIWLKYNDSLKQVFHKIIRDTPIVYSRASTILGTRWLGKDSVNHHNIDSLLSAVNDLEMQSPKGIYLDYLMGSFYRSLLYSSATISKDIVDTLYKFIASQIQDPYLLWALSETHQQYINEHQSLPANILKTTFLINEVGHEYSLAHLLDSLRLSGKKRVVLDFWASWCGPCKQEITESKAFLDSIRMQYPDLSYLYFSIDIPSKFAAAKLFSGQQRFSKNNYFLKGANQSVLFKYFTISGIPYHVYLDLSTLKFNANIIGPWEKETFKKEMDYFSNTEKEIKYE